MSVGLSSRSLEWDWYPGTIPANVELQGSAHLETTYSFLHFRSRQPDAVRIGDGATVYLGCMFDVGPAGRVNIGRYALVNGVWIICDSAIHIGDYALLSWNVVLMDTYRVPFEPAARRIELKRLSTRAMRRPAAKTPAKPIRIERNTWVGFDCCILPGVTIGEGSIIGARSVVFEDVPPYTIYAGNPARFIRPIETELRASLSVKATKP